MHAFIRLSGRVGSDHRVTVTVPESCSCSSRWSCPPCWRHRQGPTSKYVLSGMPAQQTIERGKETRHGRSMWVKIDGCEGEATDDGHQKEITILSYSFGPTHPVSSSGGGLGGGEATVHDFSVTKQVDKASPVLFKFCMNHEVMPEVLITKRKSGTNSIDFLKIKLKNPVVSSINDSGPCDQPGLETVTFAFEKIEEEYTLPGKRWQAAGRCFHEMGPQGGERGLGSRGYTGWATAAGRVVESAAFRQARTFRISSAALCEFAGH